MKRKYVTAGILTGIFGLAVVLLLKQELRTYVLYSSTMCAFAFINGERLYRFGAITLLCIHILVCLVLLSLYLLSALYDAAYVNLSMYGLSILEAMIVMAFVLPVLEGWKGNEDDNQTCL